MTISTLDAMLAGLKPVSTFYKTTGAMKAAGLLHSLFYSAGIPGPAAASTAGLSGEALTSYPGQLPFPAAVVGQAIYMARCEASQSSSIGNLSWMDRLWHNSGYVVTSTGSQSINSVALPARDINGSSNGESVYLAMEVTTTLGAGTPTLTVSYTNSAGTSGRTGTIGPITTTSVAGTFYPMAMQAGDTGVRSVQSIQSSATMTLGAVSFVLYREVSAVPMPVANFGTDRDAVALGFPRWYDDSVPFLVGNCSGTTSTVVDGSNTWTQG